MDLGDEIYHRARLRLARRTGARPLPVADLSDRSPLVREVAVEVDLIRVEPDVGGHAVRVHRIDQPQIDALGYVDGLEAVDDGEAGGLVTMDDADHEHDPSAGLPTANGDDRPALHRPADLPGLDDAGRGCGRRG